MESKKVFSLCVWVGLLAAAPAVTDDAPPPIHDLGVEVIVAMVRVPAWCSIKHPEEIFTRRLCRPEKVPPDAIRRLEELRDQRLSTPLYSGEIVRKSNIVKSEDVGQTHQPWTPRPFTLTIHNNRNGSPQAILPGSRVGIYRRIEHSGKLKDRVIVRNARVDKTEIANGGSKVTIGGLTCEECQRLELAVALDCNLFIGVPQGKK